MKRKPESGFEQYLRRVYRAVSGTRAEKKRETARVQSLLCEIPHAETMSYDILCAVAGTPESFTAGFQSRRTQSPLVLSAVMLTVLVLAFILGAAMGQAHEKTQTGAGKSTVCPVRPMTSCSFGVTMRNAQARIKRL